MILREVNKLEVVIGKGDNAVVAHDGSVWKKKMVFWKLPYLLVLSVRHCLDPMHITKNMCGKTLNTLMDTGGTSKDSLATRLDMQHLRIRKELHPMPLEDDQFELPVASWTLKKLCSFFNTISKKVIDVPTLE